PPAGRCGCRRWRSSTASRSAPPARVSAGRPGSAGRRHAAAGTEWSRCGSLGAARSYLGQACHAIDAGRSDGRLVERPFEWRLGMRVLGVDPGLTRCGLGVVDGQPGRPPSLVHVEVLRTPADDRPERRLLTLSDALDEAVRTYRPDVVVVERVFAQHNLRTVT